MSEPFLYGEKTSFRVTQNGNPFRLKVKTWSVAQLVTEATDPCNGEDRDRFQTILNGYKCDFDPYTDSDGQVLATLISNQDTKDAGQADQPLAGALIFSYRNATRQGFVLKQCTYGSWSVGATGRNAPVMNKVTFRARYFSLVPAA